jgi:dienelactone hydrolase
MRHDPGQQYLAYILKRHDELRGADKPPDSLDVWQEQKREVRRRLLESWGGFPKTPCDLAPQKLGELRREGYRVEKIVLQTRPGVLMTANAYVPDGPGRRPAVLCVHGHWKGAKQDPIPQARCIGLAKLGFFVLAVDAFGAGERGIGKALGEYHGEMTGATLWPVGLPLSGLQVYENMRAADYLQSRPEVDGTKLGITGASGGGNQTMYAGAFDERFGCVVPVCSVGTYRSYLGAACCVCEVVPDAMAYTEEGAILAMVAPRALMVLNATRDAFQFSVGEAQKSVAQAQHVFRLHGKAGNISHTLFESPHDYGKAMREAMYGWMTLHLKGEGLGNPIPEPELTTEDPETLRCFPGESRPEDFVTLPKFAAREADRLIAGHSADRHDHREHWDNTALRMKHALFQQVLGGSAQEAPVRIVSETVDGPVTTITLETEPGIEVLVTLAGGKSTPRRGALALDLEGGEAFRKTPLWNSLVDAGWSVAVADLRATGRYAVPGDTVRRAPDHNSAEWAVWTGQPLLGQWILDVRRILTHLAQRDEKGFGVATLIGIGPAGLVALGAAIDESRVSRTVLIDPLVSFRSDVPYAGQRMGILAPRILRDVGDIPHIAALAAPRKLLVSGGVTGGGEALGAAALREGFAFTRSIYRLLGIESHLTVLAAEKPHDLVPRLS